jgi:MOSC domain-containing protein YiiM
VNGPEGSTRGRVAGLFTSGGGVPKRAVAGDSARVSAEGLEGDWQTDRKHHGGPDRAVCLFSKERIDALRDEGHAIEPGALGENVVIEGVDWTLMAQGATLALGDSVVIEITRDAAPCKTIAHCFADGEFKRSSEKVHPGWSRMYAKVTREGVVSVGDAVSVELAPK